MEPKRDASRRGRAEETRRRIVEAAVELHSTVGPARTSLSAVAQLAGVSRPTLYAYFPDQASLFAACSGHAMAMDPPPNASTWRSIADPVERLRHALEEVYSYYRRNERMVGNIRRDMSLMAPGRVPQGPR